MAMETKPHLLDHDRRRRRRQRWYNRFIRGCRARPTALCHWVTSGLAAAAVKISEVGESRICYTVPGNDDQDGTGISKSQEVVERIQQTYTTGLHMVLSLLLYKYAWWEEAGFAIPCPRTTIKTAPVQAIGQSLFGTSKCLTPLGPMWSCHCCCTSMRDGRKPDSLYRARGP